MIIDKDTSVICYFYNPNIHPRSEYYERLNALKKVLATIKKKNIRLVIPDYKPSEYMQEVKGSIDLRCKICWQLRLEQSFKYAQENNIFDVTSTMLTSNYLNRGEIIDIGQSLQQKFNINLIPLNNSCNCSHHGFYKQNYCGCCFSLTEKMVCK
jgi:predicted adenine nucleotide alpha hydrolase (AANH) superfamily ATPase